MWDENLPTLLNSLCKWILVGILLVGCIGIPNTYNVLAHTNVGTASANNINVASTAVGTCYEIRLQGNQDAKLVPIHGGHCYPWEL